MAASIRCVLGLLLLAASKASLPDVENPVDYTGHKVISVIPETEDHLHHLALLRKLYELDQWNEARHPGSPIMIQLPPDVFDVVMGSLRRSGMSPTVSIHDLQRTIEEERREHSPTNVEKKALQNFDLGTYHALDEIYTFLSEVEARYPSIVRVKTIAQSYENRPIKDVTITSGQLGTKPAIIIDAGIHAREWTAVSTALYIIHQLTTNYGTNAEIRQLVDTYEFHIVPEANPDGYVWSQTRNRMWRKTRSLSQMSSSPWCVGADANRNYDIEHCGVGTSRNPCDDIYCGDYPFSEVETRAIRDLLQTNQARIKVYFTLHAFSQYWMVPYAYTKSLPPDYKELMRVAEAGVTGIRSAKYRTPFKYGTIANIIYEAAGSSVDYAYETLGIRHSYALELRDTGLYGFFLPKDQILPAAEESWAGLKAAIAAIQ